MIFMQTKILVVEDDTDVLDLLRLSFKREGFAIATATNGVDAVKKAGSLLPDVILLDVMLPQLDGFAVCKLLRKDPATASIPVVMMTGLPGQRTESTGMESGATEFVPKPINLKYLIARVRQLLHHQGPKSSDVQECVK